MHMFVAAIEELLDLQFSVEDVLVDSFRRRTSTSTKKILLAEKDSWNTEVLYRRIDSLFAFICFFGNNPKNPR